MMYMSKPTGPTKSLNRAATVVNSASMAMDMLKRQMRTTKIFSTGPKR
jgi:hypothetical protein